MFTRHRVFVLTDIENEPDDTQSLVRLLLYSNDIDVEGLVAVTSTWLRFAVHPEGILKVIEGYSAVYDKLVAIDSRYPTGKHLRTLVGEHVVKYGMEGVGQEFDSGGSEALIRAVDKQDPDGRPLHVCLWGGANCLAQALWRVRQDRSTDEVTAFVSKLRVYAISDQDDAGPWIRRHFPLVQYIVSVHGENDYFGATWLGFSSGALSSTPTADHKYVSKEWLREHIQQGPLGECYPDVMYGMEGDTPSYLACIPTGLSDPERPDFGGWGGRYKQIFDKEANHYHDTLDAVPSEVDGSLQMSAAATIWRWRTAVQNDFASRIRWSIEDHDKIQRPPVVIIDGDDSTAFVIRRCQVSDTIVLDASATFSPDDAKLHYRWFQYKEIGSVLPIPTEVPDFDMHGSERTARLTVTLPDTTSHHINDRVEHSEGRVYHLILEVTAEGRYPLTRYRRVLLDVRPR